MSLDKIFKITNNGGGKAEIIFYADIGQWYGVTSLEFLQMINEAGNVSHIDFRVSSGGGSVIAAIDMFNAIRRHPATWHAHIDGLAASAMSWLVTACSVIYMADNAQLMIHRATSNAYGNADELRKTADLIEDIENTSMINAYVRQTGLEKSEIMDLLNAETWMNAEKAKELGFIDEITETLEMAASVKISDRYGYAHAPESLRVTGGSPVVINSGDNKLPRLQTARLAAAKLKN